jgi:glyoxylase-like metal-dependent hydrolase (beta-lactamase superfamily II)
VEVTALSDGRLLFKPQDFFPKLDASAWEPYRDQLTEDGRLEMNMGCYVLRSEGKNVLVDTGLGPFGYDFEDVITGQLMASMKERGIAPAEIDFVVITHLHRDHVGWNFSPEGGEMRPTFPNARYMIPKNDWDVFTRRTSMSAFRYIAEQVEPLRDMGLLELTEGETQITGELSTLPTPGHTAGHTSLLISSQGEKGMVVGDASHVPLQAQEPDWSPRPDVDPEQSASSRRMLMDMMERENGLLIGGHYPAPGFGRLVRLQGRRYWRGLD